jgi:hypothetical protein
LQATNANLDDFVGLMARGILRADRGNCLPVKGRREEEDVRRRRAAGFKAWGKFRFPILPIQLRLLSRSRTIRRTAVCIEMSSSCRCHKVKRDDCVVVKGKEGFSIMRFVRLTGKRVELKTLNPEMPDRVMERETVDWIARVVWARC